MAIAHTVNVTLGNSKPSDQQTDADNSGILSSSSPGIDTSRVAEHLDPPVVSNARVTIIGLGGASSIGTQLARSGIKHFVAVDFDHVSATNIATQEYSSLQIGKLKTVAFKENVLAIDPLAVVETVALPYEEIPREQLDIIWKKSDLVLAMTDSHRIQKIINADALRYGTATIFAMMGDGLQQMEVTATLPEAVAAGLGCHLCQVWPREKAYQEGFENRPVIGSHVVSACLLNGQIGYIGLGLMHHRYKSKKRIAKIGAEFAACPCLLTSLDPDFWPSAPESYGVIPPGMQLFTTKLFALDSPKGWVCEACGTEGVA